MRLFIAHVLLPLVFITVAATALEAACFADYKAKRDMPPLRLHYGVIELPDRACRNPEAAERVIERRIAQDGWTLLAVMSTFDASGLAERRANAGEFHLRY